jgi:uncharacterized membrane protein
MALIKLVGIVIVILGFLLGCNPLLVVLAAGVATGLAAGIPLLGILSMIGQAFVNNRSMAIFLLILPAIGVLERYGLRERAEALIRGFKAATAGRIMICYMLFRQISNGLGVQLSGAHASFIRPIISPMAEAAATRGRPVSQGLLDRVRGMSAASENYGNFFGQLVFAAAPGMLLIKGTLDQAGYPVKLSTMALYAIPTAIAAAIIGFVRFSLFDRSIEKEIQAEGEEKP